MMAAWIVLFCAGLAEIVWVVGLKHTDGFTRPVPTAITLAAMGGSVTLLGIAVRSLPIGTAYAVWTGIGVVGAVLAGIFLDGEPFSPMRVFYIALIVVGVCGLKFASSD
jgi:quaternary ammonium compound-resistance protein SugE